MTLQINFRLNDGIFFFWFVFLCLYTFNLSLFRDFFLFHFSTVQLISRGNFSNSNTYPLKYIYTHENIFFFLHSTRNWEIVKKTIETLITNPSQYSKIIRPSIFNWKHFVAVSVTFLSVFSFLFFLFQSINNYRKK